MLSYIVIAFVAIWIYLIIRIAEEHMEVRKIYRRAMKDWKDGINRSKK